MKLIFTATTMFVVCPAQIFFGFPRLFTESLTGQVRTQAAGHSRFELPFRRMGLVTDTISAATFGPGIHEISGMILQVDENGIGRKRGTGKLSGVAITTPVIAINLSEQFGLTPREIEILIDRNPRKAIHLL